MMKYNSPVDSVANRLNYALALRGMKQADLIRLTGIGSGSLSQYFTGHVAPKQNRIFILAKALNVSEAWLMGYDVPIDRNYDKKELEERSSDVVVFSDDEQYVIEMYSKLDTKNKIALRAYLESLTK